MKKSVYIIIFLMAVVAVFHFSGKIANKTEQIKQVIEDSPVLAEIKKEIFTPAPLKSKVNEPNASLSLAGVIRYTNEQRIAQGQIALKENAKLNQAAALKVKDMFEKQYFEHISPEGLGPSDLADKVGYEFIAVGENLALGNYKDDKALVEAWMESQGHRENILNSKFTEIGLAVSKGNFEGEQVWLAVQEFGKPASSCPKISLVLKSQVDSNRSELDNLEQQILVTKQQLGLLDPKTKEEYQFYNQKVSEYNSLVRIYNNKLDILKQMINNYNAQVQAYNFCVSK